MMNFLVSRKASDEWTLLKKSYILLSADDHLNTSFLLLVLVFCS